MIVHSDEIIKYIKMKYVFIYNLKCDSKNFTGMQTMKCNYYVSKPQFEQLIIVTYFLYCFRLIKMQANSRQQCSAPTYKDVVIIGKNTFFRQFIIFPITNDYLTLQVTVRQQLHYHTCWLEMYLITQAIAVTNFCI